MRNRNSFFIVFCLCLTVGLVTAYSVFVAHFDGRQEYKISLAKLKTKIEQERLNNALLTYQLKDFQQAVAKVLPQEKKLLANYQARSLASVVTVPVNAEGIDLSKAYFEKGKKFFKNKDYNQAIKEFYNLLNMYPLSEFTVESYFFIAESYFLKKEYQNSLAVIDKMVLQYPDNDLTGFILLRMGQISELNEQKEEASEIYRSVLSNFKNEALKKQAKTLVEGVVIK